ncbi:MAG: hypothetical protein C0190_05700 [Thermodesulfobacterium geofontis]|uniref:Uncharacterized protein n=1 Tax=Thermodesulfobacterium geofontis TaxID=1295609 RepID=A0A2N7PML8_9BACT|nr:MAG: hypothetical protein C0190_05700 [Thermodesulfobacterium geofontis]
MSFKVSVCSHEIFQKDKWEKFFKNLSELLGIELIAYLLYKKGYHSIAKFKDRVDKFLIVGKLPLEEIKKKEFIKIATISHSFYIFPLLALSYRLNVSFCKIQILLTNSHQETLEKVISGEAEKLVLFLRNFLLRHAIFSCLIQKVFIKKK